MAPACRERHPDALHSMKARREQDAKSEEGNNHREPDSAGRRRRRQMRGPYSGRSGSFHRIRGSGRRGRHPRDRKEEELSGRTHNPPRGALSRQAGTVLRAFRPLRGLPLATTSLPYTAGGQAASGIRPAVAHRSSSAAADAADSCVGQDRILPQQIGIHRV